MTADELVVLSHDDKPTKEKVKEVAHQMALLVGKVIKMMADASNDVDIGDIESAATASSALAWPWATVLVVQFVTLYHCCSIIYYLPLVRKDPHVSNDMVGVVSNDMVDM